MIYGKDSAYGADLGWEMNKVWQFRLYFDKINVVTAFSLPLENYSWCLYKTGV